MISTRVHAIIDYCTGILLIIAPFLFVLGVLTILMSLVTRYELSVAKLIPLSVHLGVDIVSGLLLAVSPWLFGFSDLIWWPHLIVGLVEIVVPLMTQRQPAVAA